MSPYSRRSEILKQATSPRYGMQHKRIDTLASRSISGNKSKENIFLANRRSLKNPRYAQPFNEQITTPERAPLTEKPSMQEFLRAEMDSVNSRAQ